MVQIVTKFFAVGTIAMQVAAVVLVLSFFVKSLDGVKKFFAKEAILFSFLLSFGAAAGSLYYSNMVGYAPCELCWFQRIFLYPQFFLFGVALWGRYRDVWKYSLPMSLAGAYVAAYQYYGQMFNVGVLPCDTVGGVSSCAQRYFLEFGYITMPMMALSVFVLFIVFYFLERKVWGRVL